MISMEISCESGKEQCTYEVYNKIHNPHERYSMSDSMSEDSFHFWCQHHLLL